MSYMALYRKWRPDEFQEVKGQEHIVTTLKNQIKHERIGHAYLFCGTRGTGKTTIAKLMAKAVNCENPIDGSPCNECASCKAIASGSSMNVIEIDAASNNGVDNIRQINSAVQYSPSSGKYLVYIIDEVHMLSIGAFNALLKTLEEPPEYVIFILATTESHKIPITILSRCQRYDFKRISIETISDRLAELLEREQVPATKDALNYVAKAADGSMRDALSILDQCIAFNLGEELTYDRVLETIGAVDIEIYIKLFFAIKSSDVASAVDIIDKAVWQGKDLTQFTNEFITFVRNILMLKLDPDMSVDLTTENINRLIELGDDITEEYLVSYINILQEAGSKIAYASAKRIVLEVAIIKMCKPQMQQGYEALEKRMEELETKVDGANLSTQVVYVNSSEAPSVDGVVVSAGVPVVDGEEGKQISPEEAKAASDKVVNNLKQKYKEADYREIMTIVSVWHQIKNNAMKITRNFLDQVSVTPGDIPGSLDLVITKTPENALAIDYFEKKVNIEALEASLAEQTERTIHVGLRKLNPKDAVEARINDWDLSKIQFDNIEYKY
ncbi:MAG: DNA polymerase III subunit gamma/tau [Lachnospiraceae bacterium]|nr:DNA polymerase III subunit gamma/tau [Lachnospiraceae bacterium]